MLDFYLILGLLVSIIIFSMIGFFRSGFFILKVLIASVGAFIIQYYLSYPLTKLITYIPLNGSTYELVVKIFKDQFEPYLIELVSLYINSVFITIFSFVIIYAFLNRIGSFINNIIRRYYLSKIVDRILGGCLGIVFGSLCILITIYTMGIISFINSPVIFLDNYLFGNVNHLNYSLEGSIIGEYILGNSVNFLYENTIVLIQNQIKFFIK